MCFWEVPLVYILQNSLWKGAFSIFQQNKLNHHKTSLFSCLLDNAAILSINQLKLLTCTQPHASVTILQKVPKFTILTRNVNL